MLRFRGDCVVEALPSRRKRVAIAVRRACDYGVTAMRLRRNGYAIAPQTRKPHAAFCETPFSAACFCVAVCVPGIGAISEIFFI